MYKSADMRLDNPELCGDFQLRVARADESNDLLHVVGSELRGGVVLAPLAVLSPATFVGTVSVVVRHRAEE